MEEIHTAISFRQKSEDLRKLLRSIRYNPDLHKMLKNIDSMITELSKLEASCRHHTRRYHLEEPTKKIEKSIDHLEKLIIVAKLLD